MFMLLRKLAVRNIAHKVRLTIPIAEFEGKPG
jgi:hypothetical protein